MDSKTPFKFAKYSVSGGPLHGQTVAVEDRTPFFVFLPTIGLKGAIAAPKGKYYRLQGSILVWVEPEGV